MINGVTVQPLRVLPDARGRLMEILRSDDPLFRKFGQVYVTSVYPGVVKAWHCHRRQTDHMACVHGMARLALYDDREGSATRGQVQELAFGLHHPVLVVIPPGVWHGFQGLGSEEALILNVPTELYDYKNPDELRLDPHENKIPFDWRKRDG